MKYQQNRGAQAGRGRHEADVSRPVRFKLHALGENPSFLKLILSSGLLGLFAGISSGIGIGPPVARIDVGRVSQAYQSDLQASAPLPAKVGVSFLGENVLAVSSMDRSSARHLNVSTLSLDRNDLNLTGQLGFDTHASYTQLATFPSGDLIVNTGLKITLLDAALRVKAEASAKDVCGSPKDLDLTRPFIAAVQAASEGIAFLGLRYLPSQNSDGWACWFSALDLKPISQLRSGAGANVRSARDLEANTAVNGSFSLTPAGQRALSPPRAANCNIFDLFPIFSLLHERDASVVVPCRKGAVSILQGGKVHTILVGGGRDWNFETDAWNAPLLIASGGTVHITRIGRGFKGAAKAVLVNYHTGDSAAFADIRIDSPPPVYGGQVLAYAISPSGRLLAVLHGSELAVFETPPGLLR